MVRVSVPGKLYLVGEHAVVYGEPAILAAVGLRMYFDAKRSERVKVNAPDRGFVADWSVSDVLGFGDRARDLLERGKKTGDYSEIFDLVKGDLFKKAVIGITLRTLKINGGITIDFKSNIPVGSGLGSSAAIAVGIAKSVSDAYGLKTPIEKINQIAYEAESFKHGTPSGGDNTSCAYGGLIWFQKASPNIIRSLKDEVPYKMENFILVHIKKPEKTTGELVSGVRNLNPEYRDPRIKAIGKATNDMLGALKARDFTEVGRIINLAWDNLSELGLSVPEADDLIAKIRGIGGAAKLCGAGGGGIMLAYHKDKEKLASLIVRSGYKPMEVDLGVDGAVTELR